MQVCPDVRSVQSVRGRRGFEASIRLVIVGMRKFNIWGAVKPLAGSSGAIESNGHIAQHGAPSTKRLRDVGNEGGGFASSPDESAKVA